MTDMNRRTFLGQTATAAALIPALPRSATPDPSPVSQVFIRGSDPPRRLRHVADASSIPAGRLIIPDDVGPGAFVFEEADLSSWPDREQPADVVPTDVMVQRWEDGTTMIRRTWGDDDPPRCRLCKMGCSANRSVTIGAMICVVYPGPDDAIGDPATFRCDYPAKGLNSGVTDR